MNLDRVLRMRVAIVFGLFATFLELAWPLHGATIGESQVDRTIVFSAGSLEVSRYQYLKNELRFEQKVQEEEGRAPTESERAAWRDLFAARTIVIAKAKSQGYAERSEIQELVSTMEEYMLTQTEGPFYRSLYKKSPTTPERVEALYRLNDRRVKGVAVRFDREMDAEEVLGSDFSACKREEKVARLGRARLNSRAVYWQGSMTWPFEPFSESGERIHELDTNGMIENERSGQGFLYFYVQKAESITPYGLDARREAFAAFVTEFDKHRVQQSRRASVVSQIHFDWDASSAEKWLACIQGNITGEAWIDDRAVSRAGSLPLATYLVRGQKLCITNQDWQRWFNRRFVRAVPHSTREMGDSLVTMVVEKIDLDEARAQGLDCAPQFLEDRQNFLNYQVLDAYERENIRPGIEVKDSEIADFYGSHPNVFRRIARVHAHKLVFADATSASDYLLSASTNERKAPRRISQPLREEDVIVGRAAGGDSQPGFETVLIASAPGTVLGPQILPEGAVVFIRRQDGDSEPIPLAEVRGAIRLRLEQRRIEQKERELARVLSQQMPVRDTLSLPRETLAMEQSSIDAR